MIVAWHKHTRQSVAASAYEQCSEHASRARRCSEHMRYILPWLAGMVAPKRAVVSLRATM